MTLKQSYDDSVYKVLEQISQYVPENLVQEFINISNLMDTDFHRIELSRKGIVSAIDGSNAMIVDGGSIALAAVRALQTTHDSSNRLSRAITPITLITIGPEDENRDFALIYKECFGSFPDKGLNNDDPERVAALIRDTLEYWVAQKRATDLPVGGLLLLDGALRVTDQNHDRILKGIIETAQKRGVHLAAIAKRTRATWGGGHPLLPAMRGIAQKFNITRPWWTKVNEKILDRIEYHHGRHGDLYIASFHPNKIQPIKLELPRGTSEDIATITMQMIASCSDDGRIPGYPYPLLDAHRTVVIDRPLIEQIQQDLIRGLSFRGMDRSVFEDLFGDFHGEFERY